MEKEDKIRGITLRLAIFFGLTTFTLCIAIFYIQSILENTKTVVSEKDSLILEMETNSSSQLMQIQNNENEIHVLKDELESMRNDINSSAE